MASDAGGWVGGGNVIRSLRSGGQVLVRLALAFLLLVSGPASGATQLARDVAREVGTFDVAEGALARVALAGAGAAAGILATGGRAAASSSPSQDVSGWGKDQIGQLGRNISPNPGYSATPVSVTDTGGANPLANVTSLASGDYHGLATSNGSIWAWGDNFYGELGIGSSDSNPHPTPTPLASPTSAFAVAAGSGHSLAVAGNGGSNTVWSWGRNDSGELGIGSLTPQSSPVQVGGLPSNVTAVAAGGLVSLALTQDGKVYSWGDDSYYELGYPVPVGAQPPCYFSPRHCEAPGQVPLLVSASAIAVAYDHALALTTDGHVYAWGYNDHNQLGNTADPTCTCAVTPVLVGATGPSGPLTNVVAIAAGFKDSLAITSDGSVWAWGYNNTGQLGVGDTTDRPYPTQVEGPGWAATAPAGATLVAASALAANSLAVKSDGTIWAWGDNSFGQLGNGISDPQHPALVPSEVVGPIEKTFLGGGARVAMGFYTSYALGLPYFAVADPSGANCAGYDTLLKYCAGTEADPVQPLSGNFTYTHVDAAIAGRGPSPTFARSYNSIDPRVTALGPGWTDNYTIRLNNPNVSSATVCAGSGNVVVVGPEGRSDCYVPVPNTSTYTPPPGVSSGLVQNGDGTFTETLPDQTVWKFSADGRLTAIVDRYGNTSTLSYDANLRLTTASDPAGRGSLTFTYDTCYTGRLCSVTDWQTPSARAVQLGYDTSGRLQTVTDRNGKVTTYAYDGTSSHLTTITDANTHTAITNVYDPTSGKVTSQKDALQNQTTISYGTDGSGNPQTTITSPATSYDGFQPQVIDTFNASGQLASRATKPSANTAENATTGYTYDSRTGNLASQTDPLGKTTTYCYDYDYTGALITGSLGNLTRRIDPLPTGTATSVPVTLYKYDAKNNLVETVPPRGVTTGTSVLCNTNLSASVNYLYATDNLYDPGGVILQATTRRYNNPDLSPTQQTAITQFEYGDGSNPGRVTRVIPPRGNVGATVLGGDQSVEANVDAPAAGTAKAFQFTPTLSGTASFLGVYLDAASAAGQVVVGLYADNGSNSPGTLLGQGTIAAPLAGAWNPVAVPEAILSTSNKYWIAVLGPAGGGTPKFHDVASGGLSQVSSQTNLTSLPAAWSAGAGSANAPLSAFVAAPDTTYATAFAYFGPNDPNKQSGMLQSATDPLGDLTTYTYDPVGRRLSMVDPNGNVSGCGCAGAHTWSYTYDGEDRVLTTGAPAPLSGGTALTTGYAYDPVGNRTVVTDANGNLTRYSYDARDSLQEVDQSATQADPNNDANRIKTVYAYDNLGNLSQVKRASGDATNERATNYAYDGLNRLRTETQYPSWPTLTPTLVTSRTYDLNNNLATLLDPKNQTTTYGYDALNRLTSIAYSDGVTHGVTYAYDQGNNRASMQDGTGTTSYTYDELDRPSQVTSPGTPTNPAVGYRYDLDGNRTKLIYPDSTPVSYTFNKGSQLASLSDWASRQTSYQYFPDGSLKQATNVDSTTATYSYDNALRLTQATNQNGTAIIDQHAYTLDGVGNRTKLVETLPSPGSQVPAAWGLNSYGQLGATSTGLCSGSACSMVPIAVGGGLTGVTALAGGANHTVALKADGTVWAWGDNTYGQVGDGTTTQRNSPVQVVNVGGSCCLTGVVAIVAGANHTVALKGDGTVYAWGANGAGQLGDGTTTQRTSPVQVVNVGGACCLTGVGAIAGGGSTSLALASGGGTLYAWGSNSHGQLGLGGSSDTNAHPTPAAVTGLSGLTVTAIAAGTAHSLAVATSGTTAGLVYAWGWNNSGQLGNNSSTDSTTPVQVQAIGGGGTLSGASAVAGGDQHSLALLANGTVAAWGLNNAGQLGVGNLQNSPFPLQVEGIEGVGTLGGIVGVAAGNGHSVALGGTDGLVSAWGYDNDGQLGNGTTQTRLVPVAVQQLGGGTGTRLTGQTAIGAGRWHSLAVATTRTVTTSYGYDRMYRLASGGTPGSPTSYSYDPVGNRTSQTVGATSGTATYDKADRILTAAGQAYTVDNDGNITSYPNTTLAYDQANRLTTATISGTATTYSYDGDGKRASKTTGSTTTSYVYDANRSLPVVLTDGTLKYVWGVGLAYATSTAGAVQEVYHTDGLGSVRALTNASGAMTETYQTDEFGVVSLTQGAVAQPFRYAGEQRDGETGFEYLRARYYVPSLGRFLQRDPAFGTAASPLSLNRFGYVLNDPVSLVDPSGFEPGNRVKLDGSIDNECFVRDPSGGGLLFNVSCFNMPAGVQGWVVVNSPYGAALIPVAFFAGTGGAGGGPASHFQEWLEGLRKELSLLTLTGAAREAAGEIVKLKPTGVPYQHIPKVRQAQAGLLNLMARVQNRLAYPGTSGSERAVLQDILSQASKLLDYSERYLPR